MFFFPGRCWAPKSILNKWHRRLAIPPVDSFKSSVQRKAWWSVRTTNWLRSIFSRIIKTAQTTSRHFCCVVRSFFYEPFSVCDQYQVRRRFFSFFSGYSKAQRTRLFHALVPMVYKVSSLSNATVGDLIDWFFIPFSAVFPFSCESGIARCSFSNNLLNDTAVLARFYGMGRYTLRRSKKDRISVVFVGYFYVQVLSLVFIATYTLPIVITFTI